MQGGVDISDDVIIIIIIVNGACYSNTTAAALANRIALYVYAEAFSGLKLMEEENRYSY